MRCTFVFFTVVVVLSGCQQPTADFSASDSGASGAGFSVEILARDARAHVTYIASDQCAGRLTGTPGARRAAAYIADRFREAGLAPISETDGYYQPFEFAAGVEMVPGANELAVLSGGDGEDSAPPVSKKCELGRDFAPLAISSNGAAVGEVVFVGYGIVEPKSKGGGYDAYVGLDVTDKIVLALRHMPEDISPQRRQALSVYAGDRYKAKLAADRGAKGILLVTGPRSPSAGEIVELRRADRVSPGPIPAASISGALADRLLAKAGLDDLKTLQTRHDGETVNPHVKRSLAGVRVRMSMRLDRIRKTCHNVVGILPPTSGATEYLAVGAHYDHIGDGIGLGSLAREGEEGGIHNGADDNASGTAAVLELAAAVADARRGADGAVARRGVIFACWSGEELGIIGSSEFAADPPVPFDEIVAYFNFDMVGRLRDNKLVVQAVGSSSTWSGMIDRHAESGAFDLTRQEDPYLPTDTTAFYSKGVPGLSFFTGSHEDYNRPTDDADTLNYAGIERIARFAGRFVEETARPETEVAYARVKLAAPMRRGGGVRAYTGTRPDFTGGDVKGVRLADVMPGGPAEKAGLKSGDVIVGFAGSKVTSLRDYSDALIGVKIGEPVEVVVERGDEQLTFTITPTARPNRK